MELWVMLTNDNFVTYKTLGDLIANINNIKSISFRHYQIYDDGAILLAKALLGNETVEYLDVSNCGITHVGAEAIAYVFRNNKTIKEIDIGFNNIGPMGAKHFADCLKENKSIKRLDLSGTKIGEAGGLHLAEALRRNLVLSHIYINHASLTDKSVVALADAVYENRALLKINLIGNTITENGRRAFLNAVTANKRIVQIFLFNRHDNVTHIAANNYNLISKIADELINSTNDQSVLHEFAQTYIYVMRDFLIANKDKTPLEADKVIYNALQTYNPNLVPTSHRSTENTKGMSIMSSCVII